MSAHEIARAEWPVHGLKDDVHDFLARAVEDRRHVALATVNSTSGSAMRGIGAQMAITEENVAGSLAGGCIDADLVHRGLEAVESGMPRWLTYGEGGPMDLLLPCGKTIEVLIETVPPNDPALCALLEARRNRRHVVWMTDGHRRSCHRFEGEGRSRALAGAMGSRCFIWRRHLPRQRLVVCGHDPSMLILCQMALLSGLETVLLRPDGPEAAPPIEGLRYLRSCSAETIAQLLPDPWTSIIAATHDSDRDLDILSAGLATDAGHIGLLGSRNRWQQLAGSLLDRGFQAMQTARIRAPVGLPLASKTPHAIATSILAEVINDLSDQGEGLPETGAPQGTGGAPARLAFAMATKESLVAIAKTSN
jgi:xanthine dehydrogenase accessory factor